MAIGQVKLSDIAFKKKQIDLGVIFQESGVASCIFEFTNNSTNTFEIRSLEVSCGCTTPHSNKKTYAPGESGKITVNFDPKGIVGKVDKWVQVRGNFSDALDLELTFDAEIKLLAERDKSAYYPGEFGYLLFEKLKLNWENKMNNAVFYDTVRLENDGYAEIELQEFIDLPSFIEPLNFPLTLKPHELGMLVLKIDLTNRLLPKCQVRLFFLIQASIKKCAYTRSKQRFSGYGYYEKWNRSDKNNNHNQFRKTAPCF
jgi:hypothetical protein